MPPPISEAADRFACQHDLAIALSVLPRRTDSSQSASLAALPVGWPGLCPSSRATGTNAEPLHGVATFSHSFSAKPPSESFGSPSDCSGLFNVISIAWRGSQALPSLRADVEAKSAAAARVGDCRLIVVDPVPAYLKGVDDNRNAVLRGALSPLKNLAERLGAAVVLVSHLTKAAAGNGKQRVLGSIAYVGACRANFLFLADPRDAAGRRVLMFDNGGNTAPLAPPLTYTIEDQDGRGAQVVWCDAPVTITVEEALRPRGETPGRNVNPELDLCEEWLKETLAGGRVLASELRHACKDAGFTWTTLHRARSRIGAVTRREGFGRGSKVFWQLHDAAGHVRIARTHLTSTA
jgi:hypothetical protein